MHSYEETQRTALFPTIFKLAHSQKYGLNHHTINRMTISPTNITSPKYSIDMSLALMPVKQLLAGRGKLH